LGKPHSLLTANVAGGVVCGRGQPETADDGLGGIVRSHSTDEGGEPQGHEGVAATGPTGGKG
jgi:uncharacterized phage protein gp47/JayE